LQFVKRWPWAGRRFDEWLLPLLAVACLALAWVFAKVGSEVLEGELLRLDLAVQRWMHLHRSPAALAFFGIITYLGAKEILAPIAAFVGWRLFRGTAGMIAGFAFCALAAGEFVALLKRNFHIGRPAGGV